MGDEEKWGWPPTGAPLYVQKDDHWRHFDNSVDAVSFGFVATALLISMFLVMAIFERFLRPPSPELTPSGGRRHGDIESQVGFNPKLGRYPSSKMASCEDDTLKVWRTDSKLLSTNAREVSVLMPGELIPTFIANPAPVPCPPERLPWPHHQHLTLPRCALNSNSNASSSSI